MYLDQQEIGAGGEIQLTDAIQKLNDIQRVFAYDFEGKRYDVGEARVHRNNARVCPTR